MPSCTRPRKRGLLLEAVLVRHVRGPLPSTPRLLRRRARLRLDAASESSRIAQVRLQIPHSTRSQFAHRMASQPASAPLNKPRSNRLFKAVAEPMLPAASAGSITLGNMLRPGGKHQRHFGQRREPRRRGIEQHFAGIFFSGQEFRPAFARFQATLCRLRVRPRPSFRICVLLPVPSSRFAGDEFSHAATSARMIARHRATSRNLHCKIRKGCAHAPELVRVTRL